MQLLFQGSEIERYRYIQKGFSFFVVPEDNAGVADLFPVDVHLLGGEYDHVGDIRVGQGNPPEGLVRPHQFRAPDPEFQLPLIGILSPALAGNDEAQQGNEQGLQGAMPEAA